MSTLFDFIPHELSLLPESSAKRENQEFLLHFKGNGI